ncbi:MAG: hypothetical protein F6K14_34830 [Symploca sp. SIO2C1]|nr:hypothetical protein [Symploca sp. SIO2C1]
MINMKTSCLLFPSLEGLGVGSASCLLTLLLASGNWGIGNNHQPNGTLAVAQSNSNCDRLGPLIRIEGGEARIRRRGNANYQLARVGDVLCRGDRIKLGETTTARIRCEINNQVGIYISGRESGAANPCPPPSRCDVTDCNREPNPIISAEIISPRNTALLTNKPSFVWRPVADATSYIVVLKRLSGEEVWQREVSTTQMSYPTDQPPLKWGTTYELSVTPSSSNNAESAESKIVVLSEENVQIVRDSVLQAQLDETINIPPQFYLYLNYNLREHAIKTLEALVKQGKESADVQLWLGDVYSQVQLPELAKKSYLRSAELAKASDNLKAEKLAQERLKELEESVGTDD